VMVRNPLRAMSHALVSRKLYTSKLWGAWLAAGGMCELASNQGVPVLQAYGAKMATVSKHRFFDEQMNYLARDLDMNVTEQPITQRARESFSQAWGISPSTQMWMERFDYTSHSFRTEILSTSAYEVIDYLRKAHESIPDRNFRPWWSDGS